MKTSTKTHFFFSKTLPEWRASFVHVDGRKGKFSKTMSVMHHTGANALEGMLSYFHSCSVLCGRAKNDLNTLGVDAYFSKMEKKLLFKYIQKRVDKASSLRLKGTTTILPDLFTWKFREDFIPIPNKYQKQNT